MEKTILLIICVLTLNCSAQETAENIKAMTYNIRLNTASDGENAWPNRKAMLSSQVLFLSPDVLGVQEALPNQMQDLQNLLPGYNFIGEGRDGGDNGEYSAIFYNSKKLRVINSGTFWLSETPKKMTKGWDAALPRICTYGLFNIKGTESNFWVFNTHFDHVGSLARKESAKLIVQKIKAINTKDYPAVMMGDLNAEPETDVIDEITKEMKDTKNEAEVVFGSNGTFNGFRYNEPVKRRIDYIFVSGSSKIEVEKYAVFSSVIDQRFPSDHFPVYVELNLQN